MFVRHYIYICNLPTYMLNSINKMPYDNLWYNIYIYIHMIKVSSPRFPKNTTEHHYQNHDFIWCFSCFTHKYHSHIYIYIIHSYNPGSSHTIDPVGIQHDITHQNPRSPIIPTGSILWVSPHRKPFPHASEGSPIIVRDARMASCECIRPAKA